MYSIIYRSVAAPTFGISEIYKMLSEARTFNGERGITGCLLYHKNQFVQLLEGEQKEVTSLYGKILDDTRHTKIQTLKEKVIDVPIFMDWSMAFHDFGDEKNSHHHKLRKIDAILRRSSFFESPNEMAMGFFKNVNEILFSKS